MRRLVLVLAVSWCVVVRGDVPLRVLVFGNGDRLTGQVVSREGGRIRFRSATVGEVVVAADTVRIVPVPPPAAKPEPAEEPPATAKGAAKQTAPAAQATVAKTAEKRPPSKPKPPPPKKTAGFLGAKSRLTLGFRWLDAVNDRTDSTVGLTSERKLKFGSGRLAVRYRYGETTNRAGRQWVHSDLLRLDLRMRFNLNTRLFLQSDSRYLEDAVREIEHEYWESLGIGWHIIKNQRATLSLTPSWTVEHRQWSGHDTVESLATLFQDLNLRLTERLRLNQTSKLSVPGTDGSRRSEVDVRMNYRLNAYMDLVVAYEFDFDERLSASQGRRQERVSTSIGLNF